MRAKSLRPGAMVLRGLAPLFWGAAVAVLQTAAVQAQPSTWTGLYAGLHGGYAWGDTSIGEGGTVIGNPPYGAFACAPAGYCDVPMEIDTEGPFGGLQVGANWQSGAIVIGAEGDLGWMDIDENRSISRPPSDTDIGTVEYNWYATLTGRLGYAFDHTLVYAKGGAAIADISISGADFDQGVLYEGSFTQDSGVQTGWTIGAGLEHALTRDISIKAEYLYMDFGSETSRSSDGDIYKHEHELHTIKAGLNVRLAPL